LAEVAQDIFNSNEAIMILVKGKKGLPNGLPLVRKLVFQYFLQFFEALRKNSLSLTITVIADTD
jgi:hypothetical protein